MKQRRRTLMRGNAAAHPPLGPCQEMHNGKGSDRRFNIGGLRVPALSIPRDEGPRQRSNLSTALTIQHAPKGTGVCLKKGRESSAVTSGVPRASDSHGRTMVGKRDSAARKLQASAVRCLWTGKLQSEFFFHSS